MAIGYARQARFPLPVLAQWPSALALVAGSASIILGVWADLGALLLGAFALVAALGFHRFWELQDPEQRRTQRQNFWRNVTFLGASLALFAFFTTFGHDLPLTVTDPLIDLR
jgi:putative oxidoreductase